MRRDETKKGTVLSDDGQAAFLVLYRLLGCRLLIGSRSDARRVRVHYLRDWGWGRRQDQVFETKNTYQSLMVDDGNLGNAVEGLGLSQSSQDRGRRLRGRCDGNSLGGVREGAGGRGAGFGMQSNRHE